MLYGLWYILLVILFFFINYYFFPFAELCLLLEAGGVSSLFWFTHQFSMF